MLFECLLKLKPYFTEKSDMHAQGDLSDAATYEGILIQIYDLSTSGKFKGSDEE